ncbi:MAG: Gfo/Idh/MocA family oxidoreductase [Roseiflexaceae bacterium]|nr:Gfo/Idh/MocA family oxidoreductase [Roseiflexaceae bacterium]
MTKIRVGVVGTSEWADFLHLPSLKSHPQAEIVAICGRNRERATELAQKYGITNIYTDYHDMIANGKLDAVLVLTPDDLHYEITMAALDAGLHVLCEKPLANTASQARAMYEKAEAAGVVHMAFFTWRWNPYIQYFHNLVEQGFVGRGYHCHLKFVGDYGHSPQYSWRFDAQRANGILGDLGVHMIDLAHWLVGDIVRVSAHLANHVDRVDAGGQPVQPANDSALLLVEFANGTQGVIEASAVAQTGERWMDQRIALHGQSGGLEATIFFGQGAAMYGARAGQSEPQQLVLPEQAWGAVDQSQPFASKLAELFCQQSIGARLFIDSILAGRAVTPSFYDGWKAQQVIDAALASHEQKRWVDVQ